MNRKSNRLLSLGLTTLVGIAAAVSSAHAQSSYTWTGTVNDIWDTTTANWSGDGTTWVNGTNLAIFGGTGSTINLGTDIIAFALDINAKYTINSAGPTLSIRAADVAAGVTAIINATIPTVVGAPRFLTP